MKFAIYNPVTKTFNSNRVAATDRIGDAKLYDTREEAVTDRAELNAHWEASAQVVKVTGEIKFVPLAFEPVY